MSNDNERFFANADAKQDDELSTEELDHVAGGVIFAGPEAAAAGKGRMALGPEAASDKGYGIGSPEKSA